jgi:hypothetical protein
MFVSLAFYYRLRKIAYLIDFQLQMDFIPCLILINKLHLAGEPGGVLLLARLEKDWLWS